MLGQRAPDQLVNAYVESEAVQVPGVRAAVSAVTALAARTLTGDIAITVAQQRYFAKRTVYELD